ncbi:hypothetical protein EMPS_00144 [Entomortierella parvispora]|uniref:F-box domain-containing protein n=1 Tax=Entomortierella parvispora TaxID=205924 RepID=A0A9P3H168_9FUNG|nr:hypothetical protein EMPS_00144 [Entomortierella parvispora]
MNVPPELLTCIGKFLTHQDLTCSIRVNKTWHQVLAPCLYYTLDETSPQKPPLFVLSEYGHLLRRARVIVEGPYVRLLYQLDFNHGGPSRLQSLYLNIPPNTPRASKTVALLESALGLQVLTIEQDPGSDYYFGGAFLDHRLGFGPSSFRSLGRHFLTLENLDLDDSDNVQSWMVQVILSSCPKLMMFNSPVLFAFDMVQDALAEKCRQEMVDLDPKWNAAETSDDGEGETESLVQKWQVHLAQYPRHLAQPWVCLGLRMLRLAIAEVEPQWNELILKQISALTQLRDLELDVPPRYYGSRYLELSLDTGLGHLESLRHLEVLNFLSTGQNLQVRDVQWMSDTWPDLRDLSEDMHPVKATNVKLCQMVQSHFSRCNRT